MARFFRFKTSVRCWLHSVVSHFYTQAHFNKVRHSLTSHLEERLDFSCFDTPVESIRNRWRTTSHPPATQLLYRCYHPGHQARLGSFIYLSPQQLLCLFYPILFLLLRLFPLTAAPSALQHPLKLRDMRSCKQGAAKRGNTLPPCV